MKRFAMTAIAASGMFAAVSMPVNAQSVWQPDKPQELPKVCPVGKLGHDYVLKFPTGTDGRALVNVDLEIESIRCYGDSNSYRMDGNSKHHKTLRALKAAIQAVQEFDSMGFTSQEVKEFYDYVVTKMRPTVVEGPKAATKKQ